MAPFEPCTLKMGQDGDAKEFFAKVTGFGYNDMISLPTLTKDSILDNLKRRFKVRARIRCAISNCGETTILLLITGAALERLQLRSHKHMHMHMPYVHTCVRVVWRARTRVFVHMPPPSE